jgi:hypothetical protein
MLVAEDAGLLRCYATLTGKQLLALWSTMVLSFSTAWSLKMGQIGHPDTSVSNYLKLYNN